MVSSDVKYNSLSLPTENAPSTSNANKYLSTDFGNYLDGTVLSDYNKVRLLELSNIPGNDFIYPHSVGTQ